MKKIILFTVAILLMTGMSWAADYSVSKTVGDLKVEIRIDKNPPVVGINNITINLKDATSNDVTDAKVVIEYSMPAMPGMPAMNYKTDTQLHGNAYRAQLDLSMAGSWNVTIKINRDGKTSSTKFTVDAR